jgi:hypothetical protein
MSSLEEDAGVQTIQPQTMRKIFPLLLLAATLTLAGCETTRVCKVDPVKFSSPVMPHLNGETVYVHMADVRAGNRGNVDPSNAIFDTLRGANPGATWVRVASDADTTAGVRITIRVVKFGSYFFVGRTGVWNGEVQLLVKRRNQQPAEFSVHKVVSFPNEFGYATADDVLITAFRQAMAELVDQL